jgi:pseudaminic acid synthase
MGRSAAMQIKDRMIGPGYPAYIIAEMSANHGQNYDEAIRIIHAMKEAGADAVKIQTYTPDTLTIDSNGPEFQIGKGTIWEGKNLYQLYGEAYTPWDWQPKLMAEAEKVGLHFFSTPFDPTAVDFLESMNVPAHKIASFELVDIPLIRKVACTGKPIIMSTGMGSREEVEEAVSAIRAEGNDQLVLLKCTSAYPAAPGEMNLRTIPDLARQFGVPSGLSDHTIGIAVPVAAVALGACVIEKHFTMSRAVPGPDNSFSLEPDEFKAMVEAVRFAEQSLGRVCYETSDREKASKVFRRSLFVVQDVRAGDVFTEQNVRSIRPGHGLPPKHLPEILGRCATRNIVRGSPLVWDMVASK